MKKTSSKLFLAAAALGLAAASTVGSTYAWFTVNGSAQASGLSMTVAGGSGIMIRKHTTENVQFTDVLDLANDADLKGKTWNACTPKDPSTLKLSSFQTLDLSKTLSSSDNPENTYVYKPLESETGYVYTLDLDVRVTEGYDFYIYVSDVSDSSTKTCKAKNVVRVGVINYEANNTDVSGAVAYGINERTTFESETDYALTKFNTVFSKNLTVDSYTKPVSIAKTESNPGIKVVVDSSSKENGYTTERVTLKVWYDGNDKQCSDEILASVVSFNLNFVPVSK